MRVIKVTMHNKKLILLGKIIGAHGIQGHVLVKSFSSPEANICNLPLQTKLGEKLELKLVRENPKGVIICSIKNVTTRNDAEKLKGVELSCDRESFPDLDEDEFYIEDLKGMKAVDPKGSPLGTIKDVVNFGAGDLIEMDLEDNSSILLPFSKGIFTEITEEYVVVIIPKDL